MPYKQTGNSSSRRPLKVKKNFLNMLKLSEGIFLRLFNRFFPYWRHKKYTKKHA